MKISNVSLISILIVACLREMRHTSSAAQLAFHGSSIASSIGAPVSDQSSVAGDSDDLFDPLACREDDDRSEASSEGALW